MTGTILLIILATSVGIYHDNNKPTEYQLNMEDGSNTNIDEFKNKYDKNDKDMKKRVHKETELMIINNKSRYYFKMIKTFW